MNQQQSSAATVRLIDGKSPLGEWSHRFDAIPAIGENLRLGDVGGEPFAGYRDSAPVFRIDRDLRTGRVTVVLEAVPASAREIRNVVYLNGNYIPDGLRRDVEEFLRGHVDLPVFEWLRSQKPAPILELRGPRSIGRPALGQLQAKVRGLIERASPLALI